MEKLIEVKLDLSKLKNELLQIYNEAYRATSATSDNERRDILLILVEKLRTLKTALDKLQ